MQAQHGKPFTINDFCGCSGRAPGLEPANGPRGGASRGRSVHRALRRRSIASANRSDRGGRIESALRVTTSTRAPGSVRGIEQKRIETRTLPDAASHQPACDPPAGSRRREMNGVHARTGTVLRSRDRPKVSASSTDLPGAHRRRRPIPMSRGSSGASDHCEVCLARRGHVRCFRWELCVSSSSDGLSCARAVTVLAGGELSWTVTPCTTRSARST